MSIVIDAVNTAVQNPEIIGATLGAVVGGFGEARAKGQMDESEQAPTMTHAEVQTGVIDHIQTQNLEAEQGKVRSFLKGLGNTALKAMGPVMFVGAFTGAVLGHGIQPAGEQPNSEKPQIEVVADASGATLVLDEGKPAALIAELTKAIGKEGKKQDVKVETLLARGGTVDIVSPSELADQQPIGDAPLDQAVSTALDRAEESKRAAKGDDNTQSVGVTVITNGNEFGDHIDLVSRGLSANTRINVINVEAKVTNQQTTDNIKSVAEGTNGKYITAETVKIADTASAVLEGLDTAPVKRNETEFDWTLLSIGALGVFVTGLIYKYRGDMAYKLRPDKVIASK